MNAKSKKILAVLLIAVIFAALGVVYFLFREKPVEGEKNITVEVVNSAKESMLYELNTDVEYLSQAMAEIENLTFSGDESEYGMTLIEVNGEKAVWSDGAYWNVLVNGEYGQYGIDAQPINDGDKFSLIYTSLDEEY